MTTAATTTIPNVGRRGGQGPADSVTRWLDYSYNIFPFITMTLKICQSRFTILNKLSKNCQRLNFLPKRQKFAKSGHTGTPAAPNTDANKFSFHLMTTSIVRMASVKSGIHRSRYCRRRHRLTYSHEVLIKQLGVTDQRIPQK